MEQTETRSSGLKEKTYSFLNSEDHFTGFKVDDDLLGIIKNKRISIKRICKKTSESMEINKLSESFPSISNNNQKSQSKLNISSEDNDTKSSQSINKRLKKDHLQTEVTESNIEHTLELATPTFNLTATPKNRRKANIDISDPIYKLPFEYGWKRELVYRTSNDSINTNRNYRNGDVYYYSPNNRKLRSLREIQEQLDIYLTDTPLTIDNFTFLKQPIGMEERFELTREANTKPSKEDSFVGAAKTKKAKTPSRQPLEYDFSENENNKSSSKIRIVFKDNKHSRSRSRSSSKNNSKSNVELTNTSEIEDTFVDSQTEASSNLRPLQTDDVETNDTVNERRHSGMNGSLREIPSQVTCNMQTINYTITSLRHIFSFLNVKELLTASRVCTAWYMMSMDRFLWQNVRLKNSMVYDWNQFAATIVKQNSVSLDTKRMLIPTKNDEYERFWMSFGNAIKEAKHLKAIDLYRCPAQAVEDVIYSLLELKTLNASSIKNPAVNRDSKSNEFMTLNLGYLGSLSNLTEVRIKGITGIRLSSLPSFEKILNLKILSITSIKAFPKDVCSRLNTITTGLEVLEIGDSDCLSKDFAVSLQRFVNLTTLRLENCCSRWDNIAECVFITIRSLEKLKILELINIEFTTNVEEGLEKCVGIRSLLIIPAYVSQSATTNCHLVDCLKKLSKTLTHLVWGITHELLRVTDLFITQYQQNQHNINYDLVLPHLKIISNNIPILRTRKTETDTNNENDVTTDNVDILAIPALEEQLKIMMPNAQTKVIKVPFSSTTRIYLSEYYNDL